MAVTKTSTVLKREKLANGLTKTLTLIVLAGTYATGGVPILPADCGLTLFEAIFGGALYRDPVALQFNNSSNANNMLAMITSMILRLIYPTGGATAAPTTPAAPLVTAGATPVTSTAATGVLTPGVGKEFPNNGDVTNMSVLVEAVGVA